MILFSPLEEFPSTTFHKPRFSLSLCETPERSLRTLVPIKCDRRLSNIGLLNAAIEIFPPASLAKTFENHYEPPNSPEFKKDRKSKTGPQEKLKQNLATKFSSGLKKAAKSEKRVWRLRNYFRPKISRHPFSYLLSYL